MTSSTVLEVLLRRAWLLAGVLAVIAGLFGMHVMTTGHTAHAAVTGSTAAAAEHAAAGHSGAGHSAQPSGAHADSGHPAGNTAVVHSVFADSCGPACPSAREGAASCTPAANSGSLTVLPPAGPGAFQPVLDAGDLQTSGYSYLPPSPTPCDLSISRT